MEFKRSPQKFLFTGLDLNHPVDLMPPGKASFVQNIRSYQEGIIQSRLGVIRQNAPVSGQINTLARMNDYIFNEFVRFMGSSSGTLYIDQNGTNSFAFSDGGYSGNPISVVPYRPVQSSRVWAYLADQNKLRKINTDLTEYGVGVAPPNTIPVAELANSPAYFAPSVFDAGPGNWGSSGSGATISVPSLGARLVGVTIADILYVSGSTGWACVAPTGGNSDSLAAGMRVIVNSGGGNQETTTVEQLQQVYVPTGGGYTIAGIIYDSGSAGLCTIQPSQQLNGLDRNTLIELGSEFVRVISVTPATTGVPNASFRCITTGTHSVGETITLPAMGNLFVFLANTHSAGESLTATYQFSTVSGVSTTGPATCMIYTNAGASAPWNLGNINGVPLQPDDYIHIGVAIDHPEFLTECKLVLDIDPNTTVTHSVLDGNQNAYQYTFRPNDLQPNILQTQTNDASRTTALQLQTQNAADIEFISGVNGSEAGNLINDNGQKVNLGSGSAQMVLGQLVWTELIFKISDMQRIGSNQLTDLSQVRAIQFRLVVTGGFTIEVHNLWVGGTFGPDTHPNLAPLVYRARYRSSLTGAASVPGPMMRTGIQTRRQAVFLTFPASTDPQVDKIDIERLGGVNGPGFHYIQTITNASPTWTDNLASTEIVVNPPLDESTFQPFPITDIPRNSVVNVSGSAIKWVSGDTFNLNWTRGTEVRVNGDVTTLSATPISTTLMMVDDSMDLGISQVLEIPEATIAGQPLSAMWGPFYDTMFAVGDPNDAGAVLWTAEGNPDSAPDVNYVEVTSPSETMMNGCMYDGRSYVFSDSRLFGVLQSQSFQALSEGNSGGSGFTFTEVRNGKGLAQRWSFCVGPKIWFVSSDGIYETDGSEPISITQDIKGIFPKGDSPGVSIMGINPVNMNTLLRLEYHNSYLFFDYTDSISGQLRTLVYDTINKSWMLDRYFFGTNNGISTRYSEVFISNGVEVRNLLLGTNYGILGFVGGTSDDRSVIQCIFDTPAFNAGDPRSNKLFGDIVFDLNPQGSSVVVTPVINYFTQALTSVATYTGTTRQLTTPLDLNSGVGQFAQNLGIHFQWNVVNIGPTLYYWEPSYLDRPEDTTLRATDWTTDNHPGSKFLQGFRLIADTGGVTRSIKIQGDQKDLQTFSVTHNGEETIPYSFANPVDVSMMRILPLDEDPWRLFGVAWVWEPSPDLAANWQTQGTTHDIEGYQFLKEGYIAHNSTADLLLNINVDGVVFTYPISNSGGIYKKTFVQFAIMGTGRTLKGKLFTYQVVSSQPFRLYKKDCEVLVHPWSGGGWVVARPFGDLHRESGARI